MVDYINRDELLRNLSNDLPYKSSVKRVLIQSPAADVKLVVYGQIIETCESGKSKRVLSCCGTDCTQLTMWMTPNYCPYCGAKVDEHIVQKWREKYE